MISAGRRNLSEFNNFTEIEWYFPLNTCPSFAIKPKEKCKLFRERLKYFQKELKPDKGSYVSYIKIIK